MIGIVKVEIVTCVGVELTENRKKYCYKWKNESGKQFREYEKQ